MTSIIVKEGVRILRPSEYERLLEAMNKNEHKLIFDGFLYSGVRFAEGVRLHKNPKQFDGHFINLPPDLKSGRKRIERTVHLCPMGRKAVSLFLKVPKIPTRQTFNVNLKRWASKAGIGDEGMCCKTTRKTWESWLMTAFPERTIEIFLSQGHSEVTSLKHYLNLSFLPEDKMSIKQYVGGW